MFKLLKLTNEYLEKHAKAEHLADRMNEQSEHFADTKEAEVNTSNRRQVSMMKRLSMKLSVMGGANPIPENVLQMLTQSQDHPANKKQHKQGGSTFGNLFGHKNAPIAPMSTSHNKPNKQEDQHQPHPQQENESGKQGGNNQFAAISPAPPSPNQNINDPSRSPSPEALLTNLMHSINQTGGVHLPPLLGGSSGYHNEKAYQVPLIVENPQQIIDEAAALSPQSLDQGNGFFQRGSEGEEDILYENNNEVESHLRKSIIQASRPNSAFPTSSSEPVSHRVSSTSEKIFTAATDTTAAAGAKPNNHTTTATESNEREAVSCISITDRPFISALEDPEITKVFLFNFPELYFEFIQALMMMISLYIALWVTNFVVAAKEPWQKAVTIIFGGLSACIYVYIVRSAALLKAISKLDNDVVLEVIEQTEGSRLLGIEMRDKILSRLSDLGEPQAELYTLFREIDESGNGTLSRQEFAIFLNAIEVNFSRKKWQQIFREIDLNYDDMVSFEEFFLFLFPDHDVGLVSLLSRFCWVLTHCFCFLFLFSGIGKTSHETIRTTSERKG